MKRKPFVSRILFGVFIACAIGILNSCDYAITHVYTVKNRTTGSLKIYIQARDFVQDTIMSDTVIIPRDSGKIVMVLQRYNFTPGFNGDTMHEFRKFEVFKHDTLFSISNFKLRNRWVHTYYDHNNYKAVDLDCAEVLESDF